MHTVVMIVVSILMCCIEGFRVACNWLKVFLVTIISVLFVGALLGQFVSCLRYGIAFYVIIIICLAIVLACSTCFGDCVAAGRCLDPCGKHLCGNVVFIYT